MKLDSKLKGNVLWYGEVNVKFCVCSLNEHGVECDRNLTFRCVLLLLEVYNLY